ncbi:DNRLRE domain-containing protein [Patescibacteria group bacterium]|nr:DNRLRE domain-containing protein [Patescibacteria group bacterium]
MSGVEDEQVIPASEPEASKPSPDSPAQINKTLLGILVILALLVIGGAAFIFGSKQRTSPTPTPTPTPTQEASLSATISAVATPTGVVTPTHTPTPTPTPTTITLVLSSTSGLDGFRANNNGGNNNVDIRVGNGAFVGVPSYELVLRGFVSFSLSSIPSGVTIEKATLRMYQRSVSGTPYVGENNLIIDSIDYGGELASDDFARSPIFSNIGTLTKNSSVEWKDLEVTESVKNDISSGKGRSQFRLRFANETDGNGNADQAFFDSSNSGYDGNKPQLVVKYH